MGEQFYQDYRGLNFLLALGVYVNGGLKTFHLLFLLGGGINRAFSASGMGWSHLPTNQKLY